MADEEWRLAREIEASVDHLVDHLVDQVDAVVPAAGPGGTRALPDDSPVVHWAGPAFVVLSLVMIPWTAWLAISLPERSVSGHYAVAWSGFDVGLTVALLATAWTALRRSTWLAVAASSTATLLVVDAWFDVMTSATRSDVVMAAVLAVLVELPLAALCGWLARDAELLISRGLSLRLRRRRRRA